MYRPKAFVLITSADFVVRSAYQVGKTPLLPIFAATLGATDVMLGLIVSVSTLTGMVLKPFIGILSDRWGRRIWLLIGTGFFTFMPFVYLLVRTPEELFSVRVVHGVATAIYGPVTLAYVVELSPLNRAERIGWFTTARNAGYVIGPLAAGLMLLTITPQAAFTVVGLVSSVAFIPVILLPEQVSDTGRRSVSIIRQTLDSLTSGAKTTAVWIAGGMNASILLAEYVLRAFLPLHVLGMGSNAAIAGLYFAVQEGVHLAGAPLGGRLSDRVGYVPTIAVGISIMGLALPLVALAESAAFLLPPAVMIGLAQALVFPAATALIAKRVPDKNIGGSLGLVGTLKNAAKVTGPIVGGISIHLFGLVVTLGLLGTILLITAGLVVVLRQKIDSSGQASPTSETATIPQ